MMAQDFILCGNCGKKMRCIENGVTVVSGTDNRRGDMFECPECGNKVVLNFGHWFYDPELANVERALGKTVIEL